MAAIMDLRTIPHGVPRTWHMGTPVRKSFAVPTNLLRKIKRAERFFASRSEFVRMALIMYVVNKEQPTEDYHCRAERHESICVQLCEELLAELEGNMSGHVRCAIRSWYNKMEKRGLLAGMA